MSSSLTYSQRVAHTLKQMLLDGQLAPGDRLNEVALSTTMGLSRAPIREALHMLVAEGLVVNRPQRGKFITSLTEQEIRNSFFVGGVLEGAAAAVCAQDFDQRDFQHMEAVLQTIHELILRGGTMQQLAPLDTAFHDIIFSRINNPLLVEVSRHSCLRISKLLFYRHWLNAYTPEEFYLRHVQVLDALRSREAHTIEQCLRAHYGESGKRLSRYGAPPAPQEVRM